MINLLERFINHLKTSIRDNCESKNGLNDNMNHILNSFEEDLFIIDGVISPLDDDDHDDHDDDESSTTCANDQEEGMDSNPNTSGSSKRKDGLECLIALFNWGSNSGGGDSSTADSAIHRIWRGYMIKSIISKISEVFGTIMVNPFIDNCWISTAYKPWFIGEISGVLAIIIVLLFKHSSFLTLLHAFIKLVKRKYRFEILFRVSAYGMGYYSVVNNTVAQIVPWTDISAGLPWNYKVKQISSLYKFKIIKESLGLVCMYNLTLSMDWFHRSHMGTGLKTLIDNAYQTVLVQVATLTYNHSMRKYVYGYFIVLVHMGFAVTVWYKYLPGELYQPPEGLIPNSYEQFKDPSSVVEGYKRVTYLITKDVIQTVITTFQQQPPFNDILNTEEFDMNSSFNRERFACVGTAVMIAVFLTTKVIIPVTAQIIQ